MPPVLRLLGLLAALLLVTGLPWSLLGATQQITASPEGEQHEPVVMHGCYGCGVERWAVKTSIDVDARQVNLRHIVTGNIVRVSRAHRGPKSIGAMS